MQKEFNHSIHNISASPIFSVKVQGWNTSTLKLESVWLLRTVQALSNKLTLPTARSAISLVQIATMPISKFAQAALTPLLGFRKAATVHASLGMSTLEPDNAQSALNSHA